MDSISKATFKIEKSLKSDWSTILEILEESGLTQWFLGNESYEKFFLVRNEDKNNIICCFSIETNGETGILKSFATRKSLQGKGIGKKVADLLPGLCKDLGIKKLYAASQESPNFWRKTIFKEIKFEEIKNDFFINYLDFFKNHIDNYYACTFYFLIEIN